MAKTSVEFDDQSEIVVSGRTLLIYDPYGNACGVTFTKGTDAEINALIEALENVKWLK